MHSYQTSLQKVSLRTTQLTIESLKDRQQFSDPDRKAEKAGISSASWPISGVLWPSSIMMAALMENYEIDDLKILEAGCGLALSSLLIKQRGGNITTNDYHPVVFDFLKKNAIHNQLPLLPHYCSDWGKTSTHLGHFDLIIGSDLLYEPHHPELLSCFLARHTLPGSKVILIDPGRKQHQKFSRKMEALNFNTTIEIVEKILPDGIPFKGKLLTYKRL